MMVHHKKKQFLLSIGLVLVSAIITVLALDLIHITHTTDLASSKVTLVSKLTSKPEIASSVSTTPVVKQYGDKYANGILPVGDGKYVTSAPQVGYIYTCTAQTASATAGASTRGPWFVNNDTEYDINKKVAVSGSVSWQGTYTMNIVNGKRVIVSNDLPLNQTTGIFPIQSTDIAYLYDRNPNSIKAQAFTYNLTSEPVAATQPGCVGQGIIGVMTTGVALFDAFDAGGRDAGAWEVQDSCNGHPQMDGIYHYHTLSSCIKNASAQTVIGYALDGYPITGPTIATGNVLTTDDLDVCHGITSSISLDGVITTIYHYVMTQDFPYSISCYHGTPITAPSATGSKPAP
jgi:hypothetical protein